MFYKNLSKDRKIEELESIRGLAALLVVFFHFPRYSSFFETNLIRNSYLMVDLFFVLSGFVIYNAYSEKINTKIDLIRFQFLRFGRLYPVHILFLSLYVSNEVFRSVGGLLGLFTITTEPFSNFNWTAILQHIFLIQALGPTGNALSYNEPSWSISVEFYTYLLFGLIILLANSRKNLIFFFISIISLFLLATKSSFGYSELLRCFTGFFMGCLTCKALSTKTIKLPQYFSILILMSIILFLQLKTTKDFDQAIFFLTACLIISIIKSPDSFFNKLLRLRFLTWLGTISYAIYMSHSYVLWGISMAFKRIIDRPTTIDPDGKISLDLTNFESIVTTSCSLFIVLLLSHLIYLYIEKPMRELSRLKAANLIEQDGKQ